MAGKMNKPILKSRYMEAEQSSAIGRQTFVFEIRNRKSGALLGEIDWYSPWRQYCFSPYGEPVFNADCLQSLVDFLRALNRSK